MRVGGLRQIIKGLQDAGASVQDLKEAFGSIAKEAAALAARFAPERTGKLRKSIRGDQRKNAANVKAGGARVRYAAPINYGWKRHNIQPQRFMQKADQAIEPDWCR